MRKNILDLPKNKFHVMLDIETFGTKPNAAVISAAAVSFNPHTGEILSEWKGLFNPDDQVDSHIDFGTVRWWMRQSKEASAHFLDPKKLPQSIDTLNSLNAWAGPANKDIAWWGNSPSFDQIIMEHLYDSFGIKYPWSVFNFLDVRTIKFLLPDLPPKPEGTHDPLVDCRYQISIIHKFYHRYLPIYDKP